MSYYGMKGDYYAGDYYAGDPGFWSSAMKWGKKAIGIIPGFGPAAQIAGAATSAIVKMPGGARAGEILAQAKGAIIKHPVLSGAGAAAAAGGIGAVLARGGAGAGFGAPGMRGYHMSKPHKVNPASGVPHMVRNRRMHVTNPRALRRALRRAQGFAKLARRVLHFTSPRAPKGRALFRRRKKRV